MFLPAEVCMCFTLIMYVEWFSDYCAVLIFYKHSIAENEICEKTVWR